MSPDMAQGPLGGQDPLGETPRYSIGLSCAKTSAGALLGPPSPAWLSPPEWFSSRFPSPPGYPAPTEPQGPVTQLIQPTFWKHQSLTLLPPAGKLPEGQCVCPSGPVPVWWVPWGFGPWSLCFGGFPGLCFISKYSRSLTPPPPRNPHPALCITVEV